jgi:hypothetical protein
MCNAEVGWASLTPHRRQRHACAVDASVKDAIRPLRPRHQVATVSQNLDDVIVRHVTPLLDDLQEGAETTWCQLRLSSLTFDLMLRTAMTVANARC